MERRSTSFSYSSSSDFAPSSETPGGYVGQAVLERFVGRCLELEFITVLCANCTPWPRSGATFRAPRFGINPGLKPWAVLFRHFMASCPPLHHFGYANSRANLS
jgi:hypothetical protein